MDKQKQQQAYENYVKKKTPVHNLPVNMAKAFVAGGIICTAGQFILNCCEKLGFDKDISGGWTSMILIVCSVLLTGFNIYPRSRSRDLPIPLRRRPSNIRRKAR